MDPVVTDTDSGKLFGRYTYVDNNPYTKVDPDGRVAIPMAVVPVVVVAAAHYLMPGREGREQNIANGFRAIGNAVKNILKSEGEAKPEAPKGDKAPPVPEKLVGTVDDKSGQQGGRVNNGPLAPENGGTGDAGKDFDKLTGGKIGDSGKYPGVRGENGVRQRR